MTNSDSTNTSELILVRPYCESRQLLMSTIRIRKFVYCLSESEVHTLLESARGLSIESKLTLLHYHVFLTVFYLEIIHRRISFLLKIMGFFKF